MPEASPVDDVVLDSGAKAAAMPLLRVFVRGVLFLVPIALLVILVVQTVKLVAGTLRPVADALSADTVLGVLIAQFLAAVLIVVLCLLAGIFAGMRLGRSLGDRLEHLILRRIPGFTLIKSMTHGMVGMDSGADVHAILAWIEESWVLAFAMERHDNGAYTVFVPSAPTPAAGAIYYLHEDRIKFLDVPVSSAVACVTRLGLGSRDLLAREFAKPAALTPGSVEIAEHRL
jgi:uncharacterized membrane protein